MAESLHVNDPWNAPSMDESIIIQGGHNEPASHQRTMKDEW
jgi:hypothetical protein